MKSRSEDPRRDEKRPLARRPYQKPTIRYETQISSRAGSPLHVPGDPFDAADFLKWLQE